MSEDQKTYQRAVGVSLLGFVVQLAMGLGLLMLWLASKSQVPLVAAYFAFGGLPIWVCLAVVFQQHKLERVESLEAEQIAKRHGADTSIFENTADELAVARKRLALLYRLLVPAVSLGLSAYLIALGITQLRAYAGDRYDTVLVSQDANLAVMAVSAAMALVGFLIARYIAGMSRVTQWQPLRGGAAYVMGGVLVSLLMLIGSGFVHFQVTGVFKALVRVVPVLMILIGVEIVLNFVLSLYRPRKAGEMPRPAFDSRLLFFLASPDSIAKSINEAINYQFGFEVTQSWFWQLLTQWFGKLVLIAVAVTLAMSCLVVVEPHQQAVVTSFGKLANGGEPFGPGLNLKAFWPVGHVDYYDVESVRVLTIGKDYARELPKLPKDPMESSVTNDKVILWSNTHDDDEIDLIVAAPAELRSRYQRSEPGKPAPAEAPASEGGAESVPVFLINAEVMVSYRIAPGKLVQYVRQNADAVAVESKRRNDLKTRAGWNDPTRQANAYKPLTNHHPARLESLVTEQVTRFMFRYTIDEWIGAAGVEAGPKIKQILQAQVEAAGLGIEVLQVSVAAVHPPKKVADDFHEVVGAIQKRQTAVQNAKQERIRTLVEAAGSVEAAEKIKTLLDERDTLRAAGAAAEKLTELDLRLDEAIRTAGGRTSVTIAAARAERWARENAERGRAESFVKELEAYRKAPSLYRARRFLEVSAAGMRDARKVIIATPYDELNLRMDFKEVPSGAFDFEKTEPN